MSFINFIVTDKYISAVSDGQLTNSITNEIVAEDYKKIRKYDNCIIGVTGDTYVTQAIFDGFTNYENITLNNAYKSLVNMAEEYKNYKDPLDKLISATIMIAGFQNNEGKIFSIQIENSSIIYSSSTSNTYGTSYPPDFIKHTKDIVYDRLKFNSKERIYLKVAKQAQIDSLLEVSQSSKTVNDTIFHEVLFHP
ncbi:hypothetical protein [Lactococcus lactis]|uniref:hypothetical protein n=1 Tax=Lactococcus lactis TaxID=1358 RepID=UPI00223B0438|nr:hypothetical protein [Lactococcus lactis]MCT0440653.1 hypothetical protein [Lactococcus lactis subsp. lactis]MDT3325236.1 hypothetical protein [Bacillota bacterium]